MVETLGLYLSIALVTFCLALGVVLLVQAGIIWRPKNVPLMRRLFRRYWVQDFNWLRVEDESLGDRIDELTINGKATHIRLDDLFGLHAGLQATVGKLTGQLEKQCFDQALLDSVERGLRDIQKSERENFTETCDTFGRHRMMIDKAAERYDKIIVRLSGFRKFLDGGATLLDEVNKRATATKGEVYRHRTESLERDSKLNEQCLKIVETDLKLLDRVEAIEETLSVPHTNPVSEPSFDLKLKVPDSLKLNADETSP